MKPSREEELEDPCLNVLVLASRNQSTNLRFENTQKQVFFGNPTWGVGFRLSEQSWKFMLIGVIFANQEERKKIFLIWSYQDDVYTSNRNDPAEILNKYFHGNQLLWSNRVFTGTFGLSEI